MALDQTSERKAALLLHSLPGLARQEVLARLDDSHRDVLLPLLDELQSLGIPTGHAWVDLSAQQGEADQRQQVWNLSADQALTLLSEQSPETVAAVLSLASWPWAGQLLNQWPADQRSKLKNLAESPSLLPTPVAESLLKSLADKADRLGLRPGKFAFTRPSARQSWLRRMLRSSAL